LYVRDLGTNEGVSDMQGKGGGVGKVGLLWYKPIFKYHMQDERGALGKVCEKQKWEQDRQYKFNVTLLCVRVMLIPPLLY
jgi:hypothetical protein